MVADLAAEGGQVDLEPPVLRDDARDLAVELEQVRCEALGRALAAVLRPFSGRTGVVDRAIGTSYSKARSVRVSKCTGSAGAGHNVCEYERANAPARRGPGLSMCLQAYVDAHMLEPFAKCDCCRHCRR